MGPILTSSKQKEHKYADKIDIDPTNFFYLEKLLFLEKEYQR
jgi:hypothetical protein